MKRTGLLDYKKEPKIRFNNDIKSEYYYRKIRTLPFWKSMIILIYSFSWKLVLRSNEHQKLIILLTIIHIYYFIDWWTRISSYYETNNRYRLFENSHNNKTESCFQNKTASLLSSLNFIEILKIRFQRIDLNSADWNHHSIGYLIYI